jgi:hypothetical protein
MALLVIAAYVVALAAPFRGAFIAAGALVGAAAMVKQTGVIFIVPLLVSPQVGARRPLERAGILLGLLLTVTCVVLMVTIPEFIYWNWTYPREVLLRVRNNLFSPSRELLESLIYVLVALLPMIAMALRAPSRRWNDFRVLWLLSALGAIVVVKGLFLHYWILAVPPLALLAAEGAAKARSRATVAWLLTGYVMACAIAAVPEAGVFWGTDLTHARRVGREIRLNTAPGEKVLVWGGSALPLAFSGAKHPTRFVVPRFAEPPYGSPRTLAMFHEELTRDPPALVVDLHERGDNRFDNPLESDPFVADLIRREFRPYVDASTPWAKFYLRRAPAQGSKLSQVVGSRAVRRAYAPFPAVSDPWRELASVSLLDFITGFRARDRRLRAMETSELSRAQGSSGDTPLPMVSPLWWAEVALVQLQPKAGISLPAGPRALYARP